MAKDLQLLQTLSARLCHDLAGSIGIIDNCLSLIDVKAKSVSKEAKLLVNLESGNLVRKIKFFRSIYGINDGEKVMSAVYITKLLKDFFADREIKPKLHFEDGIIYLDTLVAKASSCLTVIASEHVQPKGNIDVFFNNDGNDIFIKVIAKGLDQKSRKDNLLVLDKSCDKQISINVENCREHYINALCNKSGYEINSVKKEDILEYNFIKC